MTSRESFKIECEDNVDVDFPTRDEMMSKSVPERGCLRDFWQRWGWREGINDDCI